ncbi:chromobox protein homolog 1 [Latimeria chalumnae]|uniref:chromobox protein homolog 1 n=1 Tax=Latimeria chalumnae TaxID=7897 RepID=UPI0003C1918C|nr:PREDICTED: chromobox protein homolog 1-like isoform X1 [Latimeria chalumnae]|eukprot:XP_005988745.1 PREDICTED: chromobox protein homolog 1-like isoform X1 [Latimeria chalumnae]
MNGEHSRMKRREAESLCGLNISLTPSTSDSEHEYEVEDIVGSRVRGGKPEFLVKWKGYDSSENSWETENRLTNCPDILEKYLRVSGDPWGAMTAKTEEGDETIVGKMIFTEITLSCTPGASFSEGYGTEELLTETELSKLMYFRNSDDDADVEDADSRLRECNTSQKNYSKRRRKVKLMKQETTESEEDVGYNTRSHRWNLQNTLYKESESTISDSASLLRPLLLSTPIKPAAVKTKKQKNIELLYAIPNTLAWSLLAFLFVIPIAAILLLFVLPLDT